MKYALVALLIFFNVSFVSRIHAQSKQTIDSLLTLLSNEKDLVKKANLYNEVSRDLISSDMEKAEQYSLEGIRFCKQHSLTKELGKLYNAASVVSISKGDNANAFLFIDSSIVIQTQLNNEKGLASALGNKGSYFYCVGDYNQALKFQFECLELNEKLNDESAIATTLVNIHGIYYVLKEYDRAIEVGRRAYYLFEKLNEVDGLATMSFNIASVYIDTDKVDSAYFYALQTVKYFEQIESREGMADGQRLLTDIYRIRKQWKEALQSVEFAMSVYDSIGNVHKRTETQSYYAQIFFDKGEYQKSLEASTVFLDMARKIGTKQFERDALKLMMDSHEALGNYEEAFRFAKLYIPLREEIMNEDILVKFKDLQAKYDTEKKDRENLELKQVGEKLERDIAKKTYYIIGAVVLIILLVIFGAIALRQRKLVAQRKTIELEQRLLRTQMNPHFIFNSLSAVQSFVYKNEPRLAGKFLSSFASLIRAILDNSREEFILLSKEIKWLESYLELQMLRFDNRFEYEINVSEDVTPESISIPPMLTQPFIENSLEHGFRDLDYLGKVIVNFTISGEELFIEVIDNGRGIVESRVADAEAHTSHATNITMERLLLLNKKRSRKMNFNILSELGKGTTVTFSLPLNS
ncbi:MAG: hypothetical protein RL204_1272 [Bacteroidota bacterium]|jgi:tetratricopeptide (TPR) repeat protein